MKGQRNTRSVRNKESSNINVKSEMDAEKSKNSETFLLCHLCLCKSENSLPLFEETSQTVLENIKIVFQIEPIQDDAAPDQICTHCLEKIDDFIVFRQMVIDNHQKLQLEVEESRQIVNFEPYIKMEEDESEVEEKEKVKKRPLKQPKKRIKRKSTPPPPPLSSSPKLEAPDQDDKYDALLRNFYTFGCPKCSQTFPRYRTLRRHTFTEHKLRKVSIKCCQQDCNAAFSQRYRLIEHLKKHGAIPSATNFQFHCKNCGKGFEHRSVLKFHLKRGSCAPISDAMFECHHCSAFYHRKGPLKRHLQLNHHFEMPDRTAKHKCSQCSKSYMSEYGLQRHIRVIHDRAEEVICDLCAKVFAERSALKFHYSSVHAPPPKVICPVCGKKLANKSCLCVHLRRSHQTQPMTCEICSKVLRNRESLLNHKRRMHEAPKFECPECGKLFNKKAKRKEHMTTHGISGDLYKCEWCDKTFNFSSSKSLHKKTQHPVEWLQSRDETYNWNKKIQQQATQNLQESSRMEDVYNF